VTSRARSRGRRRGTRPISQLSKRQADAKFPDVCGYSLQFRVVVSPFQEESDILAKPVVCADAKVGPVRRKVIEKQGVAARDERVEGSVTAQVTVTIRGENANRIRGLPLAGNHATNFRSNAEIGRKWQLHSSTQTVAMGSPGLASNWTLSAWGDEEVLARILSAR